MAKIFLMMLKYVISSMVFSLILFPILTSLKRINVFRDDMDADSVLSVLNAFKNHPSIKNMKNKKISSTYSLDNTNTDVVMKVINNLNVAKTCQVNDIPTKVIKINKDIFANFITDHFNCCITYGEFPDELKHADVIPSTKRMKSVTRQITDQ